MQKERGDIRGCSKKVDWRSVRLKSRIDPASMPSKVKVPCGSEIKQTKKKKNEELANFKIFIPVEDEIQSDEVEI